MTHDEVLRRVVGGENALGWVPAGHTDHGAFLFTAVVPAGTRNPDKVRHCTLEVGKKGAVVTEELRRRDA